MTSSMLHHLGYDFHALPDVAAALTVLCRVASLRRRCREVNKCLHKYTNDGSFEQYRLERELELHQAKLEAPTSSE